MNTRPHPSDFHHLHPSLANTKPSPYNPTQTPVASHPYMKNEYILSTHQEYRIFQHLLKNAPPHPDVLWSNENIQKLIAQKLKLNLPLKIINAYLASWKINPENSLQYAYEQAPQRLRQWLKTDYVSIRKKALREHSQLFWINEKKIENKLIRQFNNEEKYHTLQVLSAHSSTLNTLYKITPIENAIHPLFFCTHIAHQTPNTCLFILNQNNSLNIDEVAYFKKHVDFEFYFLPE
jgi:hypothetical protein